jgi:hypothetical protein
VIAVVMVLTLMTILLIMLGVAYGQGRRRTS